MGFEEQLFEVGAPRVGQRLVVMAPVGQDIAVAVDVRPGDVVLGPQEEVTDAERVAPFGANLPAHHIAPIAFPPVADSRESELVHRHLPVSHDASREAVGGIRADEDVAAICTLSKFDGAVEDYWVEEIYVEAIAVQLVPPHYALKQADIEPFADVGAEVVHREVLLGEHAADLQAVAQVVEHRPSVDVLDFPKGSLDAEEGVVDAVVGNQHRAVALAEELLAVP